MTNRIANLIAGTSLVVAMALPVRAAVLVTENFAADPGAGWASRDGEMTVGWDAGGWMAGTFAAQVAPLFQSDAIRITDATWVGNYTALYAGFTQFSFDFRAEDVLPSTFILRISDGGTTFIRNLLPEVTSAGVWLTDITVDLQHDANWLGGTGAQFSNVLQNVSFVDFQIGRNGIAEQSFWLDNLSLLDDPLGGGGGPSSAIPEPMSVSFMAIGAAVLYAVRRRIHAA